VEEVDPLASAGCRRPRGLGERDFDFLCGMCAEVFELSLSDVSSIS